MPIYMDRHDVSEMVTAENVAQLHQEDLKVQEQFGCRGLTYWFDDKRKTAFCLIEAPDKNTIQKMHNHAHGQVPNNIIEVDASIVESFLGRIEDPENSQDTVLNIINDPAFRTIMIIALQRSTLGRSDKADIDSAFNKAVLNHLNNYEGNVVKQSESLLLVSFRSATKAVQAASEIQSLFNEFRREMNIDNILLKVGLSAGVPVTGKKLLFEDTIKLAERMCAIVKGEIILSSEVRELYDSANSTDLRGKRGVHVLTQADEKFLTLLMDYIESASSNTNLKVNDFSKPMGCSKSQLYRRMMLLTGDSPNAFIKEYRLRKALTLLNSNTSNISAIAFETGFSSPSYFSKCFQKRFGRLPSDFLIAKAG